MLDTFTSERVVAVQVVLMEFYLCQPKYALKQHNMFLLLLTYFISLYCIEDETTTSRKRKTDQPWPVEQRKVRAQEKEEKATIRRLKNARYMAGTRAKETIAETKLRTSKESDRIAKKLKLESETEADLRKTKDVQRKAENEPWNQTTRKLQEMPNAELFVTYGKTIKVMSD